MDFVEDLIDEGAPQYAVSGIASIERISSGQVRLTKYSARRTGNFVEFHEVWDYQALKRQQRLYAQALDIIERTWAGNGPQRDALNRETH